MSDSDLEAEISSIEEEIQRIEDDADFAPVDIKAEVHTRRKRLAWHIFWITTGMIVGFAFTFLTSGLFLHIGIIATSVPALLQEITDFAADL